jgi:site-specific recombinase XerD
MTADPNRVRVSGPLAVHAVSFAQELTRRGYPAERAARHVQLLAHLSRWLQAEGLTAGELTEGRVAEFLGARRAKGYAEVPTTRWVITLLGYLPALSVAPTMAPAANGPVETVVEQYRHCLIHERGLATATVRGYVGEARSFLSHLESPEGLDLSGLTAADVNAYVVGQCRRRHIGSAKVMVTALRSLLRFLSLEGYTAHPLAGAVPAPSAMGGGFLPRGLSSEMVAALLASCDPSTAVGRRDLAILTVLSRLGLRAGEVAGLDLEDLDWHHGELVVAGKGARRDRLPLPTDVGEAVVAYLADGRPRVECRAVFLRVHAPITAMTASNVTEIVRRACTRAGVPVARAHRLRHSAATAMLQAGASLAEVGQVLRQSRAATTAVYAKVDRAALRTLAQPWPGAAS